ncbi:hypothetical protein CI109_103327 [Kwoniella shandongensis]|uniref:Uncharacterized protein n=1 Tax=Kwoniella shandongensis TaxID=1734106 RepID=A0A5M6BW85_9TREE|nr:uncharacterized protein CI109_004408 [Kwoniella shandongensis]KAA5527117.1 hypothetical protein CI109_004408 [Kwoniella shandongensis]
MPHRQSHRALLARIPPTGQSAWQLAHARPIPTVKDLEPNQVLIETSYVALNPFDWQGVAFKYGIGEEAKVMGRDGAGVVVGLGEKVTRFKLGDRVWFCANSSVSGTGAFQEFSVHSASEIGHTPDHLSCQQAATLGTGLITAGVALFRTLGLSVDALSSTTKVEKRKADAPWILIWGGAGITGVYLIELARLLGYRVICSASPSNHEYVRSLGADVVLDRWSDPKDLVKQIRKATQDNVLVAIDNVGGKTANLCHEVLQGSSSFRKENNLPSKPEDTLAKLVPIAGTSKETVDDSDAVRKVDSLRISFSTTFYGHPDFSEALLDSYEALLEKNLLTPARIRLVQGGLTGIEKGLEDLRHGRVPGGYKLVSRLSDTPDLEEVLAHQGHELENVAKTGAKRSREEVDGGEEITESKRVREEEKEPRKVVKKRTEEPEPESLTKAHSTRAAILV